jgi:hypothetical protein
MNKLSSTQITAANEALSRLDTLAATIQKRYASWGMSATEAKAAVNSLDSVADTLEKLAFGEESLQARQIEVLKQAKVIQQDSDESYMKTFNAPTGPKQTDGDEPFMQAYADDDTAGVSGGKSTVGRPLAP